jgi:hypothetical protein
MQNERRRSGKLECTATGASKTVTGQKLAYSGVYLNAQNPIKSLRLPAHTWKGWPFVMTTGMRSIITTRDHNC